MEFQDVFAAEMIRSMCPKNIVDRLFVAFLYNYQELTNLIPACQLVDSVSKALSSKVTFILSAL